MTYQDLAPNGCQGCEPPHQANCYCGLFNNKKREAKRLRMGDILYPTLFRILDGKNIRGITYESHIDGDVNIIIETR